MTPRAIRLKAALHVYGPGLETEGGVNHAIPSVRGFIEFGTVPEWAGSSTSFTEMMRLGELLESFAEEVGRDVCNALRAEQEAG